MSSEITLAYVQEMVRRREGRLGEKQQLMRLVSAVGKLAEAIEHEQEIDSALGEILYNTFALANTYGVAIEDCVPDSVPMPQQDKDKKPPRDLDFRPL